MLMKQGHDNIDAFDTSKKTYCADPCAAGSRRRRGFWVLWTTSRRGGGVRASRPAGAVVSILNCHPRRGRGPAPRPRSASRPRLRATATIRVAAAAPRPGHDPRRGRGVDANPPAQATPAASCRCSGGALPSLRDFSASTPPTSTRRPTSTRSRAKWSKSRRRPRRPRCPRADKRQARDSGKIYTRWRTSARLGNNSAKFTSWVASASARA